MEMHHIPLLLLFIFFCWACERSPIPEVETTYEIDRVEEPEGHWSGDYSADSLKFLALDEKYLFFDNSMMYDSAIEVCKAMIELGKPLLEFRYDSAIYQRYAKAYGGIGWNLMELGHYEEALAYSRYSLEKIKERFGENHIRATEICVGISSNFEKRGDYEHALEYLLKSTHIMNQIFEENHRYFGNNYGSLGGVYMKLGNFSEAKKYYQKALENRIALKRTGADWTRVIKNLAECHLALEELEEADSLVKVGFEFLKRTPDFELHAFTLHFVQAEVQYKNGNFADARNAALAFLENFDKGDKVHESIPVLGDGYFLLAKIETGSGRLQAAADFHDQALAAWDDHFGFGITPQIYSYLGKAEIEQDLGNYHAALENTQKALERIIPGWYAKDVWTLPDLHEIPANEALLDVFLKETEILWAAYSHTKDEKFLYAVWETTRRVIDYLQITREGFKGQGSKISLSQKAVPLIEICLEAAEELSSITQEDRYLKDAFFTLEKHKGIVLLEKLNTSFAKNAVRVDKEILEYEEALMDQQNFYNRLIFEEEQKRTGQDSAKLFHWHYKRLAVKESQDSLMETLKVRHPEFYQLKYNLPVCSVEDVQEFLEGREMLINYFQGDSSLSIFTVSPNDFSFHRIPWTSVQDSCLDAFIAYGTHMPSQWMQEEVRSWASQGRDLFRDLMPAWNEENAPASLVIVPDGRLNYLPFHLLLAQDPEEPEFRALPYLLQSCPIRYQFSASLLLQPFKPAKKATQPYAGFAPAYRGAEFIASRSAEDSLHMAMLYPQIVRDGLSPLAFNQPEVEAAAALWESEGYVGAQATEQRFKEVAPDAEILHLAMHALTNDQEPLLSQLVFAEGKDTTQDGKLHNYELQNLQLSAELTVLSACNTGAGQLRRGEGVMSVSRAFRLAGCPNIVMSLWQANDRSTAAIVTSFFEKIEKGEGKARALQTATLEFLKSADERYTHPFYWGNLMLVGDDDPVRRGWSWWWVMGAGVIFSAVLLLLVRVS
jgi:CHAT domain-containing protein